ncbi:hypothetical protein IKU74_02985 [bacterium]|nr:hypothetical protein [bacterium]
MGNLELTRESVVAVFGEPKEEKNSEMIYPCPFCKEEGADSDDNHLKINIAKGIIHCFGEPEHAKKLYKIYQNNINSRERVSTSRIDNNPEIMKVMQKELHENLEAIELLKSKGYNDFTIKHSGIGLYLGDWFAIPMYSLDNEFIGYEFRYNHNYKHSHKTKGYADDPKKTLCLIHGYKTNNENLLVMAGFKDGHLMFQYLQENKLLNNYTIVTASNGEGNTLKALNLNIDYIKKFKKVILCLDKDKTGKASTKKIAQELGIPVYELSLPFIKNDKNKSFKDFTDWYNLAKENKFSKRILPKDIKLLPESMLSKYIKYDDNFDKAKFFTSTEETKHELSSLPEGIYPTKYGYYSVKHRGQKIILKRETNFIFKVTRKVISSNTKFNTEDSYKFEIQTLLDGKLTKLIILSIDDITKPESISEKLNTMGLHFSCLNADELKAVLHSESMSCDRTLNVIENPGYASIKDKKYWLYNNACYDIEENMLIEPEKDSFLKQGVIKLDDNIEVALNVTNGMKAPKYPVGSTIDFKNPRYAYLNETQNIYRNYFKNKPEPINILAASLIRNTLEAYNNSIEPFMLIGNAIMSPFVDIIYKELKAFPVSYIYGEARSGKSNALELIANLFGYDPSFINGGNDTSKNVAHNMEFYNKIPLLYAEVEGSIKKQFPENVKSFYDRTPRKIMTSYGQNQDIKAINATVHFASNSMLPNNEQTMSRLIFSEFKQENFDFKKAIPFNAIRDDLIGLILPELLCCLNFPELIQELMKKNYLNIELVNAESKTLSIDTRSMKNIAVAMSGIDLLFMIADLDRNSAGDDIKEMYDNLKEYLGRYAEVTATKDHFQTFIEVLTEMFRQSRLNKDQDYIFNKKGLAIYLKTIMPAFRQILKSTSELGEYIPKAVEIRNSAEKHGCEYGVVNFNGKSQRALVIPYSIEDVTYIQSLLAGPKEEIKRAGEVI